MDTYIELKEMLFFAHHGVFDEERLVGNMFEVDLKFRADITKAIQSDDVADTISYADIYDITAGEVSKPSALLEHLAGRIIRVVRSKYPCISEIEIKVSKLNPPVNGQVKKASIIIKD
jgi:dihydroneopterin aldolase